MSKIPCAKCDGDGKLITGCEIDGVDNYDALTFGKCPRCGGSGEEPDKWKKPEEKPKEEGDYLAVVQVQYTYLYVIEQVNVRIYADDITWRNDNGWDITDCVLAWREKPPLPDWLNADGKEKEDETL